MTAAPAKPRRGRRLLGWLALVLCVAAVVALAAWREVARRAQTVKEQQQQAQRAVPVTVATVERRDVPLWLEGLGTVVPLSTVTVRSRVDGQLEATLFREGQLVHRGDPLARLDLRPFRIALAQAEATQQRDDAQWRNAERNLKRYRGLWRDRLVPQQQVDDQRAAVAQAAAMVGIDRALVANARLQLEWATVTAPADGVTGLRLVDPGNLVHPSDPAGLVVLAQLDPIAVVFTLPQEQLQPIAEHQAEGPLTVEAWVREATAPVAHGQLALIDNQVNPNTATLKLKAVVENPSHKLWPNQLVKARLQVTVRRAAMVVPIEAVQRGAKGTYVYLVTEASVAQPRDVEVDSYEGALALIRAGLEVGEQVVVDGQAQLKPGTKVKVQPRAGEPAAAPKVGT